ncbi:MAG: hypothetical protein ABFC12_02735 [Methanobacterium sp.]
MKVLFLVLLEEDHLKLTDIEKNQLKELLKEKGMIGQPKKFENLSVTDLTWNTA